MKKNKNLVREGWDVAYKEMHENGDDQILIDDVFVEEELLDKEEL